MGELVWTKAFSPTILTNSDFLIDDNEDGAGWTADQYWSFGGGSARFQPPSPVAPKNLTQTGIDATLGELYTIFLQIDQYSWPGLPTVKLRLIWGDFVGPRILSAGLHTYQVIAAGAIGTLKLEAPSSAAGTPFCEIGSCSLFQGDNLQVLANAPELGFGDGLFGQEYDRGGGRFTPFYVQKSTRSKIWIEYQF